MNNDINQDDIQINNENENNNQIINQLNNQKNNPSNNKNTDELFKKFVGQNFPKNNYLECAYCAKYFSKDFLLDGCCAHCWGFCFSSNFDPVTFKYTGNHSNDELKKFLKNTFDGHPKSCNNSDCIYYNIQKCNKEKKINKELGVLLGLIEDKPVEDKPKTNNIYTKKRDLNINFSTSVIYL